MPVMSCSLSPPSIPIALAPPAVPVLANRHKRRAAPPPALPSHSPPPKRRCLSLSHLLHPYDSTPSPPSSSLRPSPSPSPTPPPPHPHPHPSPSPSPSAHARAQAQAQVVDKFTKSRAVGQSHRDNERGHIQSLTRAVAEGRAENTLLYTMVRSEQLFYRDIPTPSPSPYPSTYVSTPPHTLASPKSSYASSRFAKRRGNGNGNESSSTYTTDGGAASSDSASVVRNPSATVLPWASIDVDDEDDINDASEVRSHVPWDLPEDCGIVDDVTAERLGFVKLSDSCARMLGQVYITPQLAASFMELVAMRRNLIPSQPDPTDACRPRRRRTSYRSALSESHANGVMWYALRVMSGMDDEAMMDVDEHGRGLNGGCDYQGTGLKKLGSNMSEWSKQKRRWRRIDRKLGALGRLLAFFDRVEWNFNPPSIFDEDLDDQPPHPPHVHDFEDFDDDYYGNDTYANVRRNGGGGGAGGGGGGAVQPPHAIRLDLRHDHSELHNRGGMGLGMGMGTNSTSPPPRSPTRRDAAEFGSPVTSSGGSGSGFGAGQSQEAEVLQHNHQEQQHRRRGEGAKRCSRCHKLKVSGSGHGRSKCDDGYSISSVMPYPAPQRAEDGGAAARRQDTRLGRGGRERGPF